MRIGVITTSYPAWEGDPSGHFVASEVHLLANAGHLVRVVHPPWGGAFGFPGTLARLRENPLRSVDALAFLFRARRELCAFRPERLVCHWAIPTAFPISVGLDVPLEVVSHGSDVRLLVTLPSPLRTLIVRRILSMTTTWRFVAQHLLDALVHAISAEDRVALLRVANVKVSPIEVPNVAREAATLRDGFRGRLVVGVGRLVREKRFERLLEAARGDPDTTLVIVGDGPERKSLESKAGQNVRFEGLLSRHDTLAWIAAADEIWHASRLEGASTVLREAEVLGTATRFLS